jgi:hypothetical protein
MVTVVKPLEYTSPVATLTIEGYDHSGRLILSGERRDITIVTGDTTRIVIDLRLTIGDSELDEPESPEGDSTNTDPGDTTVVNPDESATG